METQEGFLAVQAAGCWWQPHACTRLDLAGGSGVIAVVLFCCVGRTLSWVVSECWSYL